jgi:hypothetical protein
LPLEENDKPLTLPKSELKGALDTGGLGVRGDPFCIRIDVGISSTNDSADAKSFGLCATDVIEFLLSMKVPNGYRWPISPDVFSFSCGTIACFRSLFINLLRSV